jgi:hypothetical protein
MHTFRLNGLLAPEGARRLPTATFGPRSPRRYGLAGQPAPDPSPITRDRDGHGDIDAPRWVDQDFEEIVFE